MHLIGCMHSSIASIIHFVFYLEQCRFLYVVGYHTLILTGDNSHILGHFTSFLFSAKIASVTVYLF